MASGGLTAESGPFRLVVVSPVYQDAEAAAQLIRELAYQFTDSGVELRILLVDDGSRTPLVDELVLKESVHVTVEVLLLRRNVGHQRAIALGVAYVHDQMPCDALLVMDADGEDRPEDALRLVEHYRNHNRRSIVFAERTRRSESALFRAFYRIYQISHWVLTGIRVRVGNFSVVPACRLPALVTLPAMWNHYAAAVFHSRVPFETIPTHRGVRYSGGSKMNFLSLVMHGLHAISVFSDVVAVRLLLVVLGLACTCAAVLVPILVQQLYASATAPAWALYGWGVLLILLLLTIGCFSLVLNLMSQRNSLDFIPVRDYRYFVDRVVRLSPPA
jgi:glycosyltransferase involved in cell wall biosynthesis